MTPTLGSRWRLRRGTRRERQRIAVVVRTAARRSPLGYRFEAPLRERGTMFKRPFTSTRYETPERFEARFREVGPNASAKAKGCG